MNIPVSKLLRKQEAMRHKIRAIINKVTGKSYAFLGPKQPKQS